MVTLSFWNLRLHFLLKFWSCFPLFFWNFLGLQEEARFNQFSWISFFSYSTTQPMIANFSAHLLSDSYKGSHTFVFTALSCGTQFKHMWQSDVWTSHCFSPQFNMLLSIVQWNTVATQIIALTKEKEKWQVIPFPSVFFNLTFPLWTAFSLHPFCTPWTKKLEKGKHNMVESSRTSSDWQFDLCNIKNSWSFVC